MTTALPKADVEEIRRALDLLLEPGQTYELRMPSAMLGNRPGPAAGYFTDWDKMAQAAAHWSGRAESVYFLLNPCRRELIARALNRVKEWPKATTADPDILHRRWWPVDFDPVRPAGISSNDSQHEAALQRARECREWLRGEGWPDPILADSGNGAHLLYRIDLPSDDGGQVAEMLRGLAERFDDDLVKVDVKNGNPARIWKLYGTLAAKGDNLPEWPHRLSHILEAPEL